MQLIWLLACAQNQLSVDGVELEIESSLWAEWLESDPDSGFGAGTLFMSDGHVSCAQYLSGLAGTDYGYVIADAGVLVAFAWTDDEGRNAGWLGDWPLDGPSEDGLRQTALTLFEGGYTRDANASGSAELKSLDGTARGRIDGDVVAARFDAERCGKVEGPGYYQD